MRIIFFSFSFFSFLVSIMGSAFAFDPALNRDPLPLRNFIVPTKPTDSSSNAGLTVQNGGFAGDMLHLVTGITEPLDTGVSLNLSLQNQFRLGVNF
jgi:hypothetical protein